MRIDIMKKYAIKKAFFCIILIMFCVMSASNNPEANEASKMKIRITMGDTLLTATMLATETSRDLMSMLPLKLNMKDYSGIKKISDLPESLSTSTAPSGYDPSVGDITYYAPWGNLAIFYKDFGYANGLVKLGSIDIGAEQFASMKDNFEAVFELIGPHNKP